jgi:hypothetical protein
MRMSSEKIYVGPSPALLHSIAEQNSSWKLVLGELIDNAFDAGATHVELTFEGSGKNSKFIARDNGIGCSDLRTLLCLGQHTKQGTTKLGRYGIGAKDAFLWIGRAESTVQINSTRVGKTRTARADWMELIRSGEWEIPPEDFQERDALPGEQGTTICIRSSRMREIVHGKRWADLVEDVGFIYAPAIKQGRQITLRPPAQKSVPQPVKGYQSPELEPDKIDTEIEVSGKRARVYAGIVPRGVPNRRAGISYTYGFRVIIPASTHGCGSYDFTRIAGIVDLGEGWVLSKNKDSITANEEELYAAVFDTIEPLLKRAETVGRQLESAAFEHRANERFQSMVGGCRSDPDAKAKRGKGDEHGAKTPTGLGGKHARAAVEQEGQTFAGSRSRARAQSDAFRLVFQDGIADKLAEFKAPGTVVIYNEHAFARACRATNNDLAVAGLAAAVCASGSLTGTQLTLPKIRASRGGTSQENFESALSGILRDVRLDGLEIVRSGEAA